MIQEYYGQSLMCVCGYCNAVKDFYDLSALKQNGWILAVHSVTGIDEVFCSNECLNYYLKENEG